MAKKKTVKSAKKSKAFQSFKKKGASTKKAKKFGANQFKSKGKKGKK